jgi:hypothetical protein
VICNPGQLSPRRVNKKLAGRLAYTLERQQTDAAHDDDTERALWARETFAPAPSDFELIAS